VEKVVYNISRSFANNFKSQLDPENWAWISITEPVVSWAPDDSWGSTVENGHLESLPNLKMRFWDVGESLKHEDETLEPMSVDQGRELLNFILKHKNKSFVVNCAAGISRSGAICRFCEDFLGHEWEERYKQLARPNIHIYSVLKNLYLADGSN
jgi:hypothetical protein